MQNIEMALWAPAHIPWEYLVLFKYNMLLVYAKMLSKQTKAM
jgi:hypothetical protein